DAARERVGNGAGTRADIEVLLQQAVADFRAYRSAQEGVSRLGSTDLAGACGPGRDLSAESLQELMLHSAELATIDRFQIHDFVPGESHGFSILTFGGPPPLRYIVDPTFAQFVREPPRPAPGEPAPAGMRGRFTAGPMLADATGAGLARDLVRNGFLPLTNPEVARLYALGLGATPEQARRVAEALWGGEGAVPRGAILHEEIANGELMRREANVPAEEIEDLDLRQLAGESELLDEIATMLQGMAPTDPLRPQLEALHQRLSVLEGVQRRSPIRGRRPAAPARP
ncbi:MAG: hypothetical protein HUU14_08670, partial [Dehalococcoidia bacterium]|nr:hypothetical protein [Dehalococcoidia bacterium]